MTQPAIRYEDVFASHVAEETFDVPRIEGELPTALDGTLLRNGPGHLTIGDDALHYFDGLGMVASLTLREGAARFANRHVRSKLYEAEMRAGRQLARRFFTNRPGGGVLDVTFGDTAQHDVIAFGDELVATGDSKHHRLRRDTLETLGEDRWGGLVGERDLMGPMPRVDAATGTLLGFVVKLGMLRRDEIVFVELDRARRVIRTASTRLARSFAVVHDLAFTDRWFVTSEMPGSVSPWAVARGKVPAFYATRWDGGPALITMVARDGSGEVVRVEGPKDVALVLHIANAFDDGDRVVLDVCAYDRVFDVAFLYPPGMRERVRPDATGSPNPTLQRWVVDVAKRSIVDVAVFPDARGDLPVVPAARRGRACRYVYLTTPDEPDGEIPDPNALVYLRRLTKADCETGRVATWTAPRGQLVSQPGFAPRPGATDEDDGWLLSWVLDLVAGETHVAVLDARRIADGPVARVHLGTRLPMPSHASFAG